MVRVTSELALSPDQVTLYHTTDIHFNSLPVFVFHGPSTTTNSTLNSSRIQIHVFTAAGFQSYQRITISPNSPFYQSVNHLPREKQGDEVCRGLAFGLLKYFKELPEVVKTGLIVQRASSKKRPGSAQTLFAEQHAADLAASMVKVENMGEVLLDIQSALRPQNIHHVDVDLVLPPGSIANFMELDPEVHEDDEEFPDPVLRQYGAYSTLVEQFGEVAFLPTSKLRRAPSRPTSLNRTRSFLKEQKMSLRREMGELVDTEERYVIKMHELVNHIADDFREKARSRALGSFSPSEQDLQKLFPVSLDRILQTNSAFLTAIKKIMDETEEEAMQDLEAPIVGSTGSRYGGTGRLKDPTGALAFAKILLEWFPQFSDCYQEYIRASQEFPRIISSFLQQNSSFSQRVQQTGEQRLRSAVIEPVQRLPRYSLFIDNIVNYLPVAHPALPSMLKARDIITSICSLDPPEADKSQLVKRLRNLVESWPASLHPQGRLITAVDFVELPAPFHIALSSGSEREGMLLLFSDCVVLLRKNSDCNLSARGLVAEVDKPSATAMMTSLTAAAGGQKKLWELTFCGWHVLSDTRFTMSDDGRNISMVSIHELRDPGVSRERTAPSATLRSFVLQSSYDGKALKLTEEITKAKLEGRFSEKERESDKWSLRSIKLPSSEITLHTAVFEEGIDALIEGRREPAPVRVVVDHRKGTKGAPVGHYGVDIVANLSTMGGEFKYRLEVDGLNDRVFVDEVVIEHLLPTFAKRLTDLIDAQYHVGNPSLTNSLISYYSKTLKAIPVVAEGDKAKYFRPASPVKMLSTFLSSGFNSSTNSFSNSMVSSPPKIQRTPLMGNIPNMPPLTRTNSGKSTHAVQEIDFKSSLRVNDRPDNPLVRLEETFTAYVAALQSRKGNVVGKVLRSRGAADELAINALYNTFIENPFDERAASEVSVDVILVAFEKYLRMAWKDQMGQVISSQTLDELQDRAFVLSPRDFTEYVRNIFAEMAPQNRRAFIAIVKLLADLLDGCGNDGDRGALTASFAELLVVDGEPHNYINLLDRMVEDQERLFEDIGPGAIDNSAYGSISGHRSNPSATGSVTSHTSSFRRRFADHIFRSNSTNSGGSVFRTLSKSSRTPASNEHSNPSSISRAGGTLIRSHSIESPNRRPISRDRPTVLGAFDERPSSSSGPVNRLSTIGASPPPEDKETKSAKKKRRSSLSDLKSLMANATLGNSPLSMSPSTNKSKFNSSPRTPSPTKIPMAGGSIMDRKRPLFYTNTSPNMNQKENTPLNLSSPALPRNISTLTERNQNVQDTNMAIKDLWTTSPSPTKPLSYQKLSASLQHSSIPTLRGRTPSSSRPQTAVGSPAKTPGKLRLQSPAKLRERLQVESEAIGEVEASLQSELDKIGLEMKGLSMGRPDLSRPTSSSSSDPAKEIVMLQTRVNSLETKIPRMIKDFTSRSQAIEKSLESSLAASEHKVKELDQLYRETSAENELLYEKFNGELGKIVKALKGKGEKEDLVGRIKEGSEEVKRVKEDNRRLRREVAGLRALVKGGEREGN